MEDSSQFMQWAMSTLQHDHSPGTPAAACDDGGDTFSSLQLFDGYSASLLNSMVPGEPPAREGHRATNSWSSGDTDSGNGGGSASVTAMERDGRSPSQNSVKCAAPPSSAGSGTNKPLTWNFNSASALLSNEAVPNSAAAARAANDGGGVPQMMQHRPTPMRRASAKGSGSSSSAPYAQDHIIAERKRREKINERFIELSTVIPGLKKMDKATILSDATRYVKELQEKLKTLQDGGNKGQSIESTVLVKRPCIEAPDDEDGRPPSYAPAAPKVAATSSALPEIEARISEERYVMLRIHCTDAKGVLVRVLAEVEGLHLSITHANVMLFPACTLIITITAKMEEGFNATTDGIVERLNSALSQHSRNSTEETEASVEKTCSDMAK
ncbi:transcription factor bHLH18-like [Phragmites australis]|uniref:transcription factor bHLH18-like n=1 Tax=Phragmites australis TaxID=29695 RepID=UPI002D79D35A|nr:transcription factor bHLH18-like [Phragmites australis]XP_062211998.1 transcription factor bHLH18-like [Phragmites australis]XP_062211999.1 transcription factor bHLH18-like [Phragmites australis]XP_062212000.1 transcription factor bHLH18-like [Phragmites australis]XP_062212001.1 transcription factor bHLH18-like [Phragmites australis]